MSLINKLKVSASGSSAIALKLDVSKLFNGIDLVATPVIGASEAEAMSKLATNYTTAISEVVAK